MFTHTKDTAHIHQNKTLLVAAVVTFTHTHAPKHEHKFHPTQTLCALYIQKTNARGEGGLLL